MILQCDVHRSPKVPPKEKVTKQLSTTSSHKAKESSKDRTSSQQLSKSSPAASRKPERSDHTRAVASKEAAGHGRSQDTSKQMSSQDGAKKHGVKPSALSRGDLGGRSRQDGGGKDAVSRKSHEAEMRSQGVTKTSSSEKGAKTGGGERHGGRDREREERGGERERERERRREKEKEREKKSHAQPLKEHSKEKPSKGGASKLQSTSGSSLKSGHSRESGTYMYVHTSCVLNKWQHTLLVE